MKLNQKQLRSLIENIVKEAGPSRHRVDKAIGDALNTEEAGEFGLELASKICNDRSLKLGSTLCNYVADKMNKSGIGGANIPEVNGHDIRNVFSDEEFDRDLESVIASAIDDIVMRLTTRMTKLLSDAGPEHDELADDAEPDYSRGVGPDRYPRNGGF